MLTKNGRKEIEAGNWGRIYQELFHTLIHKFNWAFPSSILEVPFYQTSFAYTLYLLKKFGHTPKPASFYSDLYLKAFPTLLEHTVESQYLSPEKQFTMSYISQVFHRFGKLAGLVDTEKDDLNNVLIEKTPLVDKLVTFLV